MIKDRDRNVGIGNMPPNWQLEPLGSLFNIKAGGDWDPNNSVKNRDSEHTYPVYGNALGPGAVQGYCSYYSTPGDSFTVTGRGDVGRAIYREEPFVPIVRLIALTPRKEVSARFYAEYVNEVVKFNVESTGVPQLTAPQLSSQFVAVPPFKEQIKIADLLRSVDDLLDSLRDLVSKKRDIKQGVMQQLLTGRTRLPGFLDEWSIQRVGDFTDVRAGGTPSTKSPEFWGGDIPWMSSGEIHQKHITSVSGRITDEGLRRSAATWLPVGTVLMALAGQGKTRGTVGVSRIRLTTNQSLAGILPSNEHNSDYLFYNLESRYAELRGASTGDGGRGGLNLQIIKKLEIPFPTLEEQEAISKVLLQIDSEISLLEQKLAKVKDIKQGMMQQLLTGRVRLPLDQEVKA